MDMAPDEVHRSMAISMAIEQCTPGVETIGRQQRPRATIDALGDGCQGSARSHWPLKDQLEYVLLVCCGFGWWFGACFVLGFVFLWRKKNKKNTLVNCSRHNTNLHPP